MTGVQNIDSTAYLPPPPSTSSPADAKGTSAAGKPAMDATAAAAHGAPSDFHNELELQRSGTQQKGKQEAESAGLRNTPPFKRGSSKSGKKQDTPDDANLVALTPVQTTEPQQQILPIALALALPQETAPPQELAPPQEPAQLQENAKEDDNGKTAGQATPDQTPQELLRQAGLASSASVAAVARPLGIPQPAALKLPAKLRQSVPSLQAVQTQVVVSNASPAAAADPKVPVLPLAPVPSVTQDMPVRQEGKKSEGPASQDQVVTPAKAGASSNSQPVSPADLRLSATPAEPIAAAPQATADSAASTPSALAFAARVSAAQPKSDQAAAVNPSQSLAVSGTQTAVQIPMRYAATAQIIQSATRKNAPGTQDEHKQEEIKKDADSSDGPARPDARTDMVLPQFETVSQPAASSGSTAPQQTAPAVRAESVTEPPAAPLTSSHDIRVQVPDNKGGSTQVRFVESRGEVRVSVRTADEGLAQNLRTHLNDLTQRLSDGGMPAEIWKPAANAASSPNDAQQQSQQEGRGSGGQASGGQDGQQERQQKRPAWLDEMEASLHGEQN